MSKVYVAGKYSNLSEIRNAYSLLSKAGFNISYDWTNNAQIVLDSPNLSNEVTRMRGDAKNDLDGVLNADWTILLLTDPEYVYRGTFFELGASLARDIFNRTRHTIVILNRNSYANTCCFAHHQNIIYCNNIEDAIKYMKEN